MLQFWITRVFYHHEVYLQITRYEMTRSLCKRDMKWKSHPSMKLAPVRVFSCKHPLTVASGTKESCYHPPSPTLRRVVLVNRWVTLQQYMVVPKTPGWRKSKWSQEPITCPSVFMDQFIFRYILKNILEMETPHHLWAHLKCKRSKKKIKHHRKVKNAMLVKRPVDFADWFVGLQKIIF